MTLQKLELDKLMQQYSISQFRNISEYVKICEAFTVGLGTIQDTVDYLSDVFNLDKATGIWLDYVGWLVGETRGEYIDTDKYFCVNTTQKITYYKWTNNGENVYTQKAEPLVNDGVSRSDMQSVGLVTDYNNNSITVSLFDETTKTYTANGTEELSTGDINSSKFFYFPNSTNNSSSSLSDDLFRGQIKAKIAYNVSKGTREDLIKIIKYLVNADNVIIQRTSPMVLKISLYGERILKVNIVDRILSVLPDGVGLYNNDVTIYDNMTYEEIERQINEIVEMTNISEPDPEYTYIDIDEDLDDILEISE